MASLVEEAISHLYSAAHRVQGASGTDAPAAEENLKQAVREALKVSVSDRKIQQITGFSKQRINALRPPVVPKPRPERASAPHPRPRPTPTKPTVWPAGLVLDLTADRRTKWAEIKMPRIRVVSGGLPGLGKRR